MTKADCIATLSGGIDSTVLVHKLVAEGRHPLCVYVDYGTKSRDSEIAASTATVERLGLKLEVLPMTLYTDHVKAFILGNATQEEADPNAPFWLEGRNALISMMLAVMASSMGVQEVYLGINATDWHDGEYLDTDIRFLRTINSAIHAVFKNPVKIRAPWVEDDWGKPAIIEMGTNLYNIDWVAETHSCSSTEGAPCLDYFLCNSCFDRRTDFETVGLKDPFYKGGNY